MINRIKGFLLDIYVKRAVLYELAKRDFQQQYMGSYLDFIWVFLQPLIFIGILGEHIGRMFDETKNRPLYFVNSYLPARQDYNSKDK